MDLHIVLFLGVIIFHFGTIEFVSASSFKRLEKRIDSLERRLELENEHRLRDFETIMAKLGEISNKLEAKSSSSGISEGSPDISTAVHKDTDQPNNDLFKYLINGMKNEKKLNSHVRRDLSLLERTVNDVNVRMRREIKRIDATFASTKSEMSDHFKNLSISIGNGFQSIHVTNNETSLALSEKLESQTSRLHSAVVNLEHSLETQCDLDKINDFTESSMKQLLTKMSASFDETNLLIVSFDSCKDALSKGYTINGVYTVQGIQVFCDQMTDGGGWIVFQRRIDGSVDFFRDWTNYKSGFGNISGEFWLGNDKLSKMLSRGRHELRIDMEDFEGNIAYAKYSSFSIDTESNNYTLHVSSFSGTAGDSLTWHNGQRFRTKDKSNINGCAMRYQGAWWYNACHYSNLNGVYHVTPEDENQDGIIWRYWKGWKYSLKYVEMKFR